MDRKIITTADGSTTIHIEKWNEQYHSKHGAINEAMHVFIKNGLNHFIEKNNPQQFDVLEIGFGTGLNCLLTLLAVENKPVKLNYLGIEAYPIAANELALLNYASCLKTPKASVVFEQLHSVCWGSPKTINQNFTLEKRKQFFEEIQIKNAFDLVYFDAFGARVQPALWTEKMFLKMFIALRNKGALVTYAAKGSVRRAMQSVGFFVERLPGPPGKREMLRATKLIK